MARAILVGAQMIVLDAATSSVGTATEVKLAQALERVLAGGRPWWWTTGGHRRSGRPGGVARGRALALVVVPFVVLALAGFALLLRTLAVRYQAVVQCGEKIGVVAAPVVEGMRDVVAYAAEAS